MSLEQFTHLEASIITDIEFGRQDSTHRAILSSNETIPPETFVGQPKPNGPLIGVGLGMSLALLQHYESPPPSIVLFDINTHVVTAGRIFIELLKTSQDYGQLLSNLNDRPLLQALYQQVINQDQCLQTDTNPEDVCQFIHQQFSGFVDDSISLPDNRIPIGCQVRQRFQDLKALAETNQFQIFLGDVSHPEWVTALGQYLSEQTGIPTIYLSNTPDLICQNIQTANKFNQLLTQITSNLPQPVLWVYTLNSAGYQLMASATTPQFLTEQFIAHAPAVGPCRGSVHPYVHLNTQNPITLHSHRGIEIATQPTHQGIIQQPLVILDELESSQPPFLISSHQNSDNQTILYVTFATPDSLPITIDTPQNRQLLLSFLSDPEDPNIIAQIETDADSSIRLKISIKPDSATNSVTFNLPNHQHLTINTQCNRRNTSYHLSTE